MSSADKQEPKLVDEGEIRTTFKPLPPPYTGDDKNLPKSYNMQEVQMRKALKKYGANIQGDIYKEWKEFQGYFSDQFTAWPLQQKMKDRAKELYLSNEDLGEDESQLLNYTLKPLDIEMDIMDDFTCLVIGRRRSGKSFWMKWLMYHLRHRFPCGMLFHSLFYTSLYTLNSSGISFSSCNILLYALAASSFVGQCFWYCLLPIRS